MVSASTWTAVMIAPRPMPIPNSIVPMPNTVAISKVSVTQ
jgi:hypothetical protein